MAAGCSMHVPRPLGRHGRRALNVWWMVPAWLCQQSTDDVECRRQMSGEGSQQGTTALFHEDNSRPERTAGMWLAPKLVTSGAHEAMGLCVLTASLRKPNGRRRSRRSAGLAACQRYRRESSCSSSPCWQSVHEQRPARHVVAEIAARSGSDVEPRSTLWQRLWRGSSRSCQRRYRPRGRRSKKLAARQCCQCGCSKNVIYTVYVFSWFCWNNLNYISCSPSRNKLLTCLVQ